MLYSSVFYYKVAKDFTQWNRQSPELFILLWKTDFVQNKSCFLEGFLFIFWKKRRVEEADDLSLWIIVILKSNPDA